MIEKCRRDSWIRSIALAALALGGGTGCSEELGPERMIVARVTGFVRNGREPVRDGWIEFVPVDGTVGNPFSAKIHEDGSFEAAGVPVGTNLIRLPNASLGSVAVERLYAAYHSPIRRVVPARPTGPIMIDLFDETLRYKLRSPGNPNSRQRKEGDTP